MKQILLLFAVVAFIGCDQKEDPIDVELNNLKKIELDFSNKVEYDNLEKGLRELNLNDLTAAGNGIVCDGMAQQVPAFQMADGNDRVTVTYNKWVDKVYLIYDRGDGTGWVSEITEAAGNFICSFL